MTLRYDIWNTNDEISFFNKLGIHSEGQMEKDILQRKYAEAIRNRQDWGDINVKTLNAYIEKYFSRESEK